MKKCNEGIGYAKDGIGLGKEGCELKIGAGSGGSSFEGWDG